MAGQHFSLKWHSFASHIAFSLDSLRVEQTLCDVTLCCEGKRIRAHKIILSVCSTYFRETFFENPCKHPVIIFKNVKYQDLLSIVEFMYKGEVSIAQDSLSSFLHVAEMLQVRGLSESQDLLPAITEKNIITTPVTTQTESLFISVPEGNKILFTTPAIATQQVPELIKSPLKQQQQPQQQQQTQQIHVQVQQKKNEFLIDQSGIAAKRKKPAMKENRTIRTNNNTTTQFVTENLDAFNKQDAMIVDENGKESVYEDVEYLTMKNEMPDYIVPITESADQNNQDNMEETTTFIQETFEIIEDPSSLENQQKIITEDGTTTTVTGTDNQTEMMNQSESNEDKSEEGKAGGDAGTSKWTQCQYCKLVITSVNLWRHVRTQHTTQPPKKCEFCKKTFKNKYSLREHVRISHESKQNIQKLLSSDPEDLQVNITTPNSEDAANVTTTESQPVQQQQQQQQQQLSTTTTKVIYLNNIS